MYKISLKQSALFIAVNAMLFTTVAYSENEDRKDDREDRRNSTTLSEITVPAATETASGPVEGLAASTVSSTTGTDDIILESIQSVTVIGQQEMETIGASNLQEAVGYSAGINIGEAHDRTTESFIIRGFTNNTSYRDGQKYQVNGYNGEQETYGLERVDVVKGPASVLSGSLPPGGVVSTTSKKAFFDNQYEVNAEGGSFGRKQVSTDINQEINDELAVRLVGLYRDSDTFLHNVTDDRTYIAPSLTWQPSNDTTLRLKADYQHDVTAYANGLPYEGTVQDTANGKIKRDFHEGIDGFDEYNSKRYTLGYDISHNINPNLQIKHSLQYMNSDINFPRVWLDELVANSKTEYTRVAQKRTDKSDRLTSKLSAIYDWDLNKNIHNTTLFGVDYSDDNHSTERYNGTASNIDAYNPDRSNDSLGDDFEPMLWSSTSSTTQKGVYLQNKTTINDKLVGVLGIRHDKVKQEQAAFFMPEMKKNGSYSATTGRAGLVYLMDNGVAPYASVNQSFETNLGTDRNGDLFKPTIGTQYEIGVRYQPEGSDTLLTASVYRIDQTNVAVSDPNNAPDEGFEVQLGKVRSQGVELEAKTQVGDNANLIAAYAYTDARIRKSSPTTPEEVGKRSGNVPYNKFSLWGDYRFADYGLTGLKAGVGVRYTGSSRPMWMDDVKNPSFTLVDAMVSYDWNKDLKLSLNVKNLFDKEYVTCTYDCFYGEPRNVVGKVTYKW